MNPEIRPVRSADGSFTLKNLDLNEHYHSLDGALEESYHVYIKNGLLELNKSKKQIKVFELGLGLGYNAFLSLKIAEERSIKMEYYTCESFPLDFEDIIKWGILNSGIEKEAHENFKKIHRSEWEILKPLNLYFSLFKTKEPIETLEMPSLRGLIDIIYFDAFAPSKQPDIWSPKILKKCFDLLRIGGILVTYCSQGQFKRNLASIGFVIETKIGFGNKREMTLAVKS